MRVAFKRGVALILPVSFVWLFAACVAICSSHSEEANPMAEGYSHLLSGVDADCCSITTTQSLLPERVGFSISSLNIAGEWLFSIPTGQYVSSLSYFSSYPPLIFSGTLRI